MQQRSHLCVVVLCAIVVGTSCLDILPVTKTSEPDKKVDMPPVPFEMINQAYDRAIKDYEERLKLEEDLPPSALIQPTLKTVEARHQRFLAFKQSTADLDLNATLFESASRFLKEKLNLTSDQARFALKKVPFPRHSEWKYTIQKCHDIFNTNPCDKESKYRTEDGSCNNLENPTWGRSFTCMSRLLPPVYDDGISSTRKSQCNKALPNVRSISLLIHEALITPNASFTHMMMAHGQFVNHDITMGLMTRTAKNHSMMSCCPIGENQHTECDLAIRIPPNPDDFYSQHGQTCMNFVRSALCNSHCTFGPREHSTQITIYLDNSNIYGSTQDDMAALRLYKDGLMKSQIKSGEEYLPASSNPTNDQCSRTQESRYCFLAGDRRVNEQPALSAVHNVFLRQHNRVAKLFKGIHPTFSDDELFNLARRIVNAQYQSITFKEFLPILLGEKYMDFFGLNTGQPSVYMPDAEASVFNEFMSAAFRFGHTLIQNTLERGPGSTTPLNLDEVYLSPFILMEGEFDPVLKGLASQPGKLFDTHLVTAVTHTMYREKNVTFGMDLASLNIQRGRDQGTAGYTEYIRHCFNRSITTFEDLDDFMTKEHRMNLQNVYGNVADIDLFTGGVSEDRLEGAVVGPTFGCIIGIQFYRLKYGDRFFFEHRDQTGSFTDVQLAEVRKTTLAHILCENSRGIMKIAPNVFLFGSETNKLTDCKDIPSVDYTVF